MYIFSFTFSHIAHLCRSLWKLLSFHSRWQVDPPAPLSSTVSVQGRVYWCGKLLSTRNKYKTHIFEGVHLTHLPLV